MSQHQRPDTALWPMLRSVLAKVFELQVHPIGAFSPLRIIYLAHGLTLIYFFIACPIQVLGADSNPAIEFLSDADD